MAKILVVEDEADMQFVLTDNLSAEGHDVDAVGEGKEGCLRALSGDYDLVILDIMLPDVNGVEVCKQIRARNVSIPIIFLTAKGDEIDKVVGLEVGADDYITKPFSVREVLARTKAALRRAGIAQSEAPRECIIGDGRVDFARREFSARGETIKLTPYENGLLRYLASRRGDVVSRDDILREVWGQEASPSNRTVDNYVVRVRHKLEEDPGNPRYVITVHGSGYKLV